jgi:hypothetical protein
MVQELQFRKVLPVSQSVVAVFFGGWGLWQRNEILSHAWLGWNSTARFHVWPWPFKFAAIANMPAFFVGLLLAWPLDALRPGLPEWVSYLPVLLLIPLLWYLVGSWLDKRSSAGKNKSAKKGEWILLLLFIAVCAAASSMPTNVGSYTNYLEFGTVNWMTVAIGMTAYAAIRKYKSKLAKP